MAELPVWKLTSAFTRKGFEEEQTHHRMFYFMVQGKRTSIRTRLSHGEKRVDDWLLSQIARQVHLSRKCLREFIDCDITQEAYLRMMIDGGYVILEAPPSEKARRP